MTEAHLSDIVELMEARRLTVARQLVDVGRSLHVFDFEGEQYLSRVVSKTMREAERAFSDAADAEHFSGEVAQVYYDRAEHLAKVVAFLVHREAPKFAANPQQWIETRRELRT
jgi:hypothetical protein